MKIKEGPHKGAPLLFNRLGRIIYRNANTILSELSSNAQSEQKISIEHSFKMSYL
jgi:hypothetical protein